MIYKQQIVYSLLAFVMLVMACGGGSSNDTPVDGDMDGNGNSKNAATYQGKNYAIKAGFQQEFELNRSFSPLNHSSSEFQITDGEFFSTVVDDFYTIWHARDASVWLYATLYSLGTTGFQEGTFAYASSEIDKNDLSLSAYSFFQRARFLVDSNNDGDFDDNESFDVVDGTITLTGDNGNYTMVFDLMLENGEQVTGSFLGQSLYLSDN